LEAALDAQSRRIAELEQRNGQTWMDRAGSTDVQAIVDQAVADAEQRVGSRAGYDNGFVIGSEDGSAKLKIRGLLLARYDVSTQNDGPVDDTRSGFEIARSRFGFAGHVVDPSWKYFLWTGFSANGSAILLDATITKDLAQEIGEGWSITAGQFKLPLWREWLVSETSQQAIERSLLNKLSGSYTQGVMLQKQTDNLRWSATFNDGLGEISSPFTDEDAEFALGGRVEWKLAGDWKQYGAFESWRGDEPIFVFGGAVHYQEGESGTPTVQTDILRWSADATVGLGGANLFAAVIGDHEQGGTECEDYGVLLQAGVFLTDRWELFGRYEWADTNDCGDVSLVTVGVNYFFKRFNLRWTSDVGYSFEPVSSFWASDAAGWRVDAPGEDGQVVFRTQMQLLF
jgi:hypothetical protein